MSTDVSPIQKSKTKPKSKPHPKKMSDYVNEPVHEGQKIVLPADEYKKRIQELDTSALVEKFRAKYTRGD